MRIPGLLSSSIIRFFFNLLHFRWAALGQGPRSRRRHGFQIWIQGFSKSAGARTPRPFSPAETRVQLRFSYPALRHLSCQIQPSLCGFPRCARADGRTCSGKFNSRPWQKGPGRPPPREDKIQRELASPGAPAIPVANQARSISMALGSNDFRKHMVEDSAAAAGAHAGNSRSSRFPPCH